MTKEDVVKEAERLREKLQDKFRVDVDARDEYTPGWKYNHWELKGVPIRIEIGPEDIAKKQVVLVRRDMDKKQTVTETKLVLTIKKALKAIHRNLVKKADKYLKKSIRKVGSMTKLKQMLRERGGIVKIYWCGDVECADYVKAETDGGVIRGTLYGDTKKYKKGRCIYCKKETDNVVYIAKQY